MVSIPLWILFSLSSVSVNFWSNSKSCLHLKFFWPHVMYSWNIWPKSKKYRTMSFNTTGAHQLDPWVFSSLYFKINIMFKSTVSTRTNLVLVLNWNLELKYSCLIKKAPQMCFAKTWMTLHYMLISTLFLKTKAKMQRLNYVNQVENQWMSSLE